MMFGIGLMHFANFQHIKDAKHVFQGAKKFRTKYTHSTPLDPKWCLGVFWSISKNVWHVRRCKICVSGLMH
jgi:hypothetical protein